jgi:hypothetical protein
MGNVMQAGVGQAPARQTVIYAGTTHLHRTESNLYLFIFIKQVCPKKQFVLQ